MSTTDLATTWHRIEAWLGAHVPRLAADLAGPAPATAIAAAEAAFGQPLPADLVASVAIHDGQRGAGFELFGRWGLMSLDRAVEYWRMFEDLAAAGTFEGTLPIAAHGPVRAVWWTPAWLPFAVDARGDVLALDLDPTEGGRRGQVIRYLHDRARREVIAPDLGAWLAAIADDLEADRYEVVAGGAQLALRP